MTDAVHINETNRLIASNKVEGTAVFDFAGERLGNVAHIMIDKQTGQAEFAVMQFGGFLGIGSDYYPIPWNLLKYDVDQGGYVVDLDKDRLVDAPRFADEEPAYDDSYGRQVYGHYGAPHPAM